MISRRVAGDCFLLLSVALAVFITGTSPAVEGPSPSPPLHYRRVFVPMDDLESQAKGMIPLKREEFERRIVDSMATRTSALASHVRVQEATYSARLEGDQFIDGSARLDVVSASGEAAPLPLTSTLAFGKPQWEDQPPRLARMGTTPNNLTVVLVEKSGKLLLPWSLRGNRTEGQDATFDLALPKAAVSRLVLQLPADQMVESDFGIVSRLTPDSAESELVPATNSSLGNWLIELGGLSRSRLRVRGATHKTQNSGVVLVRESATHILSPVNVSSEYSLQLDVHQTELKTLRLELDTPSRIIGVRLSGLALPWRESPATDPLQTVLQVDLPEPLAGSGSNVTVNTVTTLETDRPWRLPRLRLQGSTWQEGTGTMILPPALQIGNVQLVDARQTSISAGSDSQPEQTFQFQYLSATGQVAIETARENPRLNILGGLVLRHESTQLAATLSLDLSVDSGEQFLVEGITNENWIIDSVDTSPQDLLEDRQFVPLEGRKFSLGLRFARPVTSREKTRLILRAHRQLPAEGEVLSPAALKLVEFHDTREVNTVVALRVADNSREFQLTGDLDQFRIDPESAAPEELSLLDSSAAGILFRLDRQAEGAQVSLVPSDPRFTAAVETSAKAQRGRIEHRAIARIVPTSASLGRLYVRASGPIPAAMRWRLVGAPDLNIASQTLLPAQAMRGGDGQRESVWELLLSRPTNQPITLEAAWETSPSTTESLPLFSFPEAASQIGMVRVETSPGVLLRLETAGVKPVPAPPAPAGGYSSIRGNYRYEPGRQAAIRLVAASNDDVLPAAWVKSCLLASRFSPDGSATHEITWNLENHGLDRFPFSLPAGVRVLQVSLEGEDLPLPSLDPRTQQHFIPLPDGRRNPVLSMVVSSPASKAYGFLIQRFAAPLTTTPLKILDRKWQVTLPPGIRPAASETAANAPGSGNWQEIWKTRICGILDFSLHANHAEKFEFPWMESEPLTITAYSPGMMRIGGIALAIAVASFVVWRAHRRLVFVLMIASVFASAALLLPPTWSPLAAGVFWGCIFGGLLSLVRPLSTTRQVAPRSSPSTRTMMATGLTGSLLLVAAAIAHLPTAAAAPEEAKGGPSVSKTHRVIIPVDADQKPVGDYVYVSLDFYSLLFRSPDREQLPAWLRRFTTYELNAAEEGVAANVVMRLEIETLATRAQVSLPFRRGEIHLLEGRAALDGEPISLDWDDAGTALRFEVERPGVYQLTLAFSVAAKPENGANSWRFSVPSAPRSILRIKSPLRPDDWSLPAAMGAITKSPDDGDLLAELGSTGVIEVSRNDQRRATKDMTEAEQFVWWQLRPGSVTAESLIRIRPVSGSIKEIKLLADPHLRILPLKDETRVSHIWTEEGDLSTIHLSLAEPTMEMVQIRCKFLLLDASGIGRFVLPQLEVVSDRKTKQWQAISIGPESEISPDPKIPLVSHSPVEFVDNFGGAPRPPNLAVEATGQSPAFLVRPREGIVHAKEFVDISLGREDAEVRYRVDLSGIPPHRFQEVIGLPTGFRVRKAVLLEQGAAVSLTSTAAEQNSLAIHRARSPGPVQQLEVEGTIPLSAVATEASTVPLPQTRFSESEGAIIRIYRTPAILASIKSSVGVEPSATPEGAPWDPLLGYLLANYKSAPSTEPAAKTFVFETRPNNPVANCRLITRMERTTPRSWSAVVQCEVTPKSGQIDAVRLEVPAEWSGPFEFTPPMEHQVVLLPGQTQRHLIIRPYQNPLNKLRFSIRGPVKSQTGDAPHAPVILPLDTLRADSFVVLPGRIADEDLQWQTSGLQAMAAGESKDLQLTDAGQEIFRVVAPRFTATLMQLKSARAKASVALADIEVRPVSARTCWARANYYLLPGGRDEVKLQMPAGSELVQVLVNDSPSEVRAQAVGVWSVRLGHDQLAQLVTVIYFLHQQDVTNTGFQASLPIWEGISPGKTNWMLLPNLSGRLSHLHETNAVTKCEDVREPSLENMAAVIRLIRDAGDTIVSGLTPQQLRDWLSQWRSEFARADQSAKPTNPRPTMQGMASSGETLETQRRSLEAEFFTVLGRYPDVSVNAPPAELNVAAELWGDDREHVQVFQTADSSSLALTISDAPSNFLYRLGLATCLLFLAAAVSITRARFRELFASSPYFVLALAAALCFLLLPFPLVSAPVLAAAAAWFALRRNWPSAKVETPSRLIRPHTPSRLPQL